MDLFKTLDSSIISFVILLIIYINLISRSQKVFMGYKLLISLVLINMFMLVIDFFTWVFNGLPGVTNHIIHMGVNFLLYTFAPLPILIWILYINFQVSHDPRKVAILKKYLAIPFVLNAVITGISLFTGWYFKIDANNVYERGSFFFIYIIFIGILFGISFVYIIRNRQVIEK